MLFLQYLIASLKIFKEIRILLHYLKFQGNTKIVKPRTNFEHTASIVK